MKPTSRSALGFAVACFVGVATATPTAQWIDFTGGTANDNGTTSFSIEVSGWTLTATGTKNTDGSVTLRDVATLTTTGDGLNAFSLVLDCAKPPATTGNLIQFAISSSEGTKIGRVQSANAVFRLGHGSNLWQSATGNTYTWGDTFRQFITLTHLSDGSIGTRLYANDTEVISYPGLRWDGYKYPYFTVGFNGLTVYGIYLYSRRLTDANAVLTELNGIVAARGNGAEEKSATVEAGSSAWSSLDWEPSVPTAADKAILTATGEATITVAENEAIGVVGLTIADGGPVTFSGAGRLSVSGVATINADTDFADLATYLCSVSVAADKTLTLRSLEQITSSTGSGILALRGNSTIANTTKLGSGIPLKVLSGKVTYTAGDNGDGLSTGRFITVSGANSTLKTTTKDALGWNFPNADAQKLIIEQGGRLELGSRETLITPIELCAGHIVLTTAEGDRALDFYDNNATRVDVTVKAADEGASAASPTVSTLSSTGTGDARKVNLRNGDLRVEVEENAKFEVSAQLISYGVYGSTLGKLVKLGDGVLELGGTTANTYTPGTEIRAGTVHLTGAATLGTGAATIASGAKLLVDGATDGTIKALTNTITGASAESIGTIVLANNGVLDLRRALTGETVPALAYAEGATGTLIVPAGSEAANLQVPAGATLKLVLSAAQLVAGRYTYSFTQAEGSTVSFWREDAEGNLTEVTGTTEGSTFLPTLSFIFTNATGTGRWADEGNWSDGEVPSATDAVEIPANTALMLTENVSVAGLRVTGTNSANTLTLSGGALTVSGSIFLAGANLTATTGTLPLTNVTAIDLGEGTTLDYTVTSSVALPALSGSGTFIKRGTTDMTFKRPSTPDYLAQVVVAEGTLDTGEIQTGSKFHITVEAGATFLTRSTTSLTSTASTLCLKGGAFLDLRNGRNATPQFQAAITIDATPEKPAIIQGSRNGTNSNLQGAITGKGTLEIRKAPDQTDANAFTISGNISDAADGTLALKVTQTGSGAAVTLTGNNTYTGGTTIADGATVKVSAPGKFGSGDVTIVAGGVVEFYQPGTGSVNHSTENYSKVTGEGTVRFTGSSWRALPSNAANIWASTLAVENNVQGGLVLVDKSKAYKIGTLSGTGCFRADLDPNGVATLEVTQRADATFSGYFHQEGENGRIPALKVSGDSTKVLTLSFTVPSNKNPSPATLTVEAGASVVLAEAWAGPVTVNGSLAIGTDANPATVTLPQAVTEGADGEIVLPAGANLTLSADSVFSGALTGTGTVTVASAKTLKLQPSEPKLFAGVIAGAGSLVVGNGTAASTVKLTGANTYTGTTTVALGATLSLAGEKVLSDAFGDGSAVVVNGTLELAAGSYCRRTTGAGTIRVLNDQTFSIGQAALPVGEQWSGDMTTGLTDFTGTLALVGNFELRNAGPAEYTYAPTGFSVRFEADNQGMIDNPGTSDGQLLCDETGKASFTLAPGCSLSGEGFILCPITFAASSVIEIKAATAATAETPGVHATSISLTKVEEEKEVKAMITLPSGEGEHILLKADVASNGFLYPATSANVPASVFAFADESTKNSTNAVVKVSRYPAEWQLSYEVVQVLANPTVPPKTADGVAEAVRDQAVNEFGVPVSVKEVVADKETTPKADVEGALFFENVVKTVDNRDSTYTAKVTYDFGVSAITVKRLTLEGTEQLCVVVCAKVKSSATSTAATFKESAQVQLYLNDKLCDGTDNGPLATVLTSAIDSSVDDSDKSVRWFAVPFATVFPKESPTGTKNFTVKVTEAVTP